MEDRGGDEGAPDGFQTPQGAQVLCLSYLFNRVHRGQIQVRWEQSAILNGSEGSHGIPTLPAWGVYIY